MIVCCSQGCPYRAMLVNLALSDQLTNGSSISLVETNDSLATALSNLRLHSQKVLRAQPLYTSKRIGWAALFQYNSQ